MTLHEFQQALAAEPHLGAYLDHGDTTPDGARRRCASAQGRLRKTLAEHGTVVRVLMTPANGITTSAFEDSNEVCQ